MPSAGVSFGAHRSFIPRHCRRCSCGETRIRIAGEQGANRAGKPAQLEAGPLKGCKPAGKPYGPVAGTVLRVGNAGQPATSSPDCMGTVIDPRYQRVHCDKRRRRVYPSAPLAFGRSRIQAL